MAINNIAMNAYQAAMEMGKLTGKEESSSGMSRTGSGETDFASAISDSLRQVNDLQMEKENMIQSFAAGETENVHDLMISLQKAGIAMQMTSAVRNKVMEAYKEIMHMQL